MSEQTELTNCIFQKSWWLDAVAPGQWESIEIEKGGEIFARMPIVHLKQFGQNVSVMPIFTQVLGPCIKQLPGKEATVLSKEKELMTELINQLPDVSYFKQRFHHSITNWLPFYWHNFEQTTRYTYVLEDISEPDTVWDNMQGNIRREIKKARKSMSVTTSEDIDLMWKFHEANFANNRAPEGTFADFQRLYTACKKHNSGQIMVAKSETGEIVSAMFFVWDEHAAYYLLGGTKDKFKNTGVFSHLMFESIKFASEKTVSFDFEGSMIESIERFYRGFGASQKPYFHISKSNGLLKTMLTLKKLI